MRKSGILLPITCIPSKYGIGTLGKEAYNFVDFLSRAGQKLWQILPLGPTGYGDSPYQSFSTFAGNPYYIDLEMLMDEGLLTEDDCVQIDSKNGDVFINYEEIYDTRFSILRKAYIRFRNQHSLEFEKFQRENDYWLSDYALYMAIKDSVQGKSFLEWDDGLKEKKIDVLQEVAIRLKDEVEFYKFQQFEFFKQWFALKKYTNEKGIQIVGDIPIYVAMDSADSWSNPELFQLDEKRVPQAVAGCPPDAFSSTGQLWGNPLYRWDYHQETEFRWWIQRISYCFQLYDIVRIDHFRAFDEYYSIPYGEQTAQNGHWEKGPGYAIFDAIHKQLGDVQVIAEDLGFLTESVLELVKRCGYPGMKILQFAFDSDEKNAYLPYNYEKNCVVYTGTHDNNTTKGWYDELGNYAKDRVNLYTDSESSSEVVERMVRLALGSVADTAIIPIQDYLGLGSKARINFPSTLGENWKWRLNKNDCTEDLAKKINEITKIYGR